MNYIKHLSGFFDKVSKDDRLNPTHVSLYVSLFQFWNACRFHNPISISRSEAMKVSKINSKATYHKCMRELNDFGYLSYHPSYNPFKGSLVYLFNFQAGVNNSHNQHTIETSPELAVNDHRTKIETSAEQALVPYINNSNNNKQQTGVNGLSQKKSYEKRSENSKINSAEYGGSKYYFGSVGKQKSHAERNLSRTCFGSRSAASATSEGQKERSENIHPADQGRERPLREEVGSYFSEKQWPEQEAAKFFNHYESNGWLVGGKSPMQDWKASAEKWMSNAKDFGESERSLPRGSRGVEGQTNKDYSEPL